MTSKPLTALAQALAGEFENPTQAFEQPAWFVSLRLWHRPLPKRIQGQLALFAEQANILYLDQPYRQRVMVLKTTEAQQLQVQYLALKQPGQFQGAGANPALLAQLSLADLEPLPGCVLNVAQQGATFKAQPPPEAKCFFEYDGKTRQVILGFEVGAEYFHSNDRGVDPETGKGLWGALMGPYEFKKCQNFASELSLD